VTVRRQLLEAVRAFQAGAPAAWRDGVDFAKIRALAATVDTKKDWRAIDTIAGRGIERARRLRAAE
jgi:hypothetical protein